MRMRRGVVVLVRLTRVCVCAVRWMLRRSVLCLLCCSPCGDHPFVYSADGVLLCVPTSSSADVYDCTEWPPRLRFSVARPAVVHCCFSPLHSFLVTYERKSSQQAGENLRVWSTESGAPVIAFFQSREVSSECWPLQWTADERLLFHQVSNELQIHSGQQPTSAVLSRLQLPNVSQFSVAPSQQSPYHLTAFSPLKTTDPGRINVYAVDGSSMVSTQLLSRAVMQAEEMTIRWSGSGLACLVETTTATDTSGKSYFGTSHLHLFAFDPSATPFTSTVEFSGNEGPVHDFCFLPNQRQEFLVVQGYQPAVSTLFSVQGGSCLAVKQYGKAPRNTIRVSPHGRFLMIGGFGNLSGEMDLSQHNTTQPRSTAGLQQTSILCVHNSCIRRAVVLTVVCVCLVVLCCVSASTRGSSSVSASVRTGTAPKAIRGPTTAAISYCRC